MSLKNLAVLIDGDNASVNTIGQVFEKIETLGKISCKKIYGDWGQTNLSSWQPAILKYAIDAMQQFSYVKGKNATDIALVIEAMDLLHSGEYDGFCLVSSDSDFASLAVRIRKSGLSVYGFGKASAVSLFKHACDEFFAVETLVEQSKSSQSQATKLGEKWDSKRLKCDTKLLNALREGVTKSLSKDSEWARYPTVNSYFKKNHRDINPENYGYGKLIHLYREIDIFDVKYEKEDGSEFQTPFIKLKHKDKAESKPVSAKYTTQQLQADKNLVNTITQLIQDNPKTENGWSNISYIASQLNQNPQIDVKKYGYPKFSDLMTNIRLFDIKKQQNAVYVKLKDTQTKKAKANQTTKTTHTATIDSQVNQPLIINHHAQISIETAQHIDAVLWRLTANKKVRGDGDMIFYGQTHSEDDTIHLDIDSEANQLISEFDCQLANQTDEIQRIIFTLSHENSVIPNHQPVKLIISQNNQRLFDGEFMFASNTAQSVLLFELVKVATGWQFLSRQQLLNGDLRLLCEKLGVEVSDE